MEYGKKKWLNVCLFSLVASLTFILCNTGVAFSTIIFDNGAELENSGMSSDYDAYTKDGYTWYVQAGDTFELSSNSTLASIRWWGFNVGGDLYKENDFTINIFDLNNGIPDTNPFYSYQPQSVSRQAVTQNSTNFEYFSVLDPVVLNSNTLYLLSIVNNSATPNDLTDHWVWLRSIDDGFDDTHYSRQSNVGTPVNWTGTFMHDLAFQMYDSTPVPEPSTIVLMGLGLVGLAGMGRKKLLKK